MKWVQRDGEYFLYNSNNQCLADFFISEKNKSIMYILHLTNCSDEIPIEDTSDIKEAQKIVENIVKDYLQCIVNHYSSMLNELLDYNYKM